MSLALARERYGACPRCPQPTWHDGPCPLWAAAEERDHPVPCQTGCGRRTWRNDAQCSRCAASLSGRARDRGQGAPPHPAPTPLTHRERAARNAATAAAVERLLAASVPGAGGSRPALHQPPAPGAPRVLP